MANAQGIGQPKLILTRKRADAIIAAANRGVPRTVQASAGGMAQSSLGKFISRGRAGERGELDGVDLVVFAAALDEAATKDVCKSFEVIDGIRDKEDARDVDRLAASRLKIQAFHPHMFSAPAAVVEVETDEATVKVTVGSLAEMSDEDLAREVKG